MISFINFSSAKYIATDGSNTSIEVVVDGTTMFVPLDPDNRHYAEILRQVDAGTLTVEDAD
tara:strand:- start:76 stop:258 length:183 start_codon:yes stop_codon:yes gene_type:complete